MGDRDVRCLFEAGLGVEIVKGELAEYPRVDPSLLTEEERELELQYRHKRIYAVGHGAGGGLVRETGDTSQDLDRIHAAGGRSPGDGQRPRCR